MHPCDRQTDRQTELRWLRRAIAVPAVARKNDKMPGDCIGMRAFIIINLVANALVVRVHSRHQDRRRVFRHAITLCLTTAVTGFRFIFTM